MKTYITLFVAVIGFFPALAQTLPRRSDDLRNPESSDKEIFSMAIEAVLHDFPSNLRHITGELVLAEGEIENYACTVELPGAEHCVITRYHSASDTTASWQAKMYTSDDFGKASAKYHALYNRLQSCYLLLADSSMVYLKGEWDRFGKRSLCDQHPASKYGRLPLRGNAGSIGNPLPGERLGSKYQHLQRTARAVCGLGSACPC